MSTGTIGTEGAAACQPHKEMTAAGSETSDLGFFTLRAGKSVLAVFGKLLWDRDQDGLCDFHHRVLSMGTPNWGFESMGQSAWYFDASALEAAQSHSCTFAIRQLLRFTCA